MFINRLNQRIIKKIFYVEIQLIKSSCKFNYHNFEVQFSCSVVSDSLPPHGLQHARFPCDEYKY